MLTKYHFFDPEFYLPRDVFGTQLNIWDGAFRENSLNGSKPFTIFVNSSVLHVRMDSEYASVVIVMIIVITWST